ncbi:crossover junction endodeoxyribonuclease RuvC [Alicyclobacillus cellulosilyticus]|uniref:Crossover junction endodeoxyribonuclease RuvC n=2 Tax=Alicyclobacillus cellulosilyticus TaxID=1003997 RepID=A0A917KB60_9BACL|nr:crossover junction endodeoxyribonuclease RuvC [Alicyclobacillus cellulosilyticus]
MGWGIVDHQGQRLALVACGCIETQPAGPVSERLARIYQELRALLAAHQPQEMAVEELFFHRNTTTAFHVGQARGVALLAAAHAGMPVAEYTPMQVKQAVVGYGKAEKRQVQEMVRVLLGLSERPRPDDTADALAVAITHAHASAYRDRVVRPGPAPGTGGEVR